MDKLLLIEWAELVIPTHSVAEMILRGNRENVAIGLPGMESPCLENVSMRFRQGTPSISGALVSAATGLPPAQRNAVWAVGGGLALTRIVLLAHWTSDVVAASLLEPR